MQVWLNWHIEVSDYEYWKWHLQFASICMVPIFPIPPTRTTCWAIVVLRDLDVSDSWWFWFHFEFSVSSDNFNDGKWKQTWGGLCGLIVYDLVTLLSSDHPILRLWWAGRLSVEPSGTAKQLAWNCMDLDHFKRHASPDFTRLSGPINAKVIPCSVFKWQFHESSAVLVRLFCCFCLCLSCWLQFVGRSAGFGGWGNPRKSLSGSVRPWSYIGPNWWMIDSVPIDQ